MMLKTDITYTSITSSHGPLTKRIYVDDQGQLQKSTSANFYRGQYKVKSIKQLADFARLLESATPETAFTYGVPDHASGMIVRDGDLHLYQSAISRTRNFFSWPRGPGILMIDDDSGLVVDCFCEFLREAVPFLDGVEMIVRPSRGMCRILCKRTLGRKLSTCPETQ